MYKRKSAVDLTDIAIGILILGITVSVGARVLILYRDSRLTDLDTFTTANEVVTAVNETGSTLDNVWFSSVTEVTNTTDGAAISSSNYTTSVDSDGIGTIYCDGCNNTFNNTLWNVTYVSYNTSSPQWALPNDAATGLAEYGNWFDIIVIVGIAGLILSLIFLAFKNKGGNASVSY